MLKELKRLREKRIPELGICNQPGIQINKKMFARWPEWTGSFFFPVPHPTLSPRDAYRKICNLWDRSTAYGQARWRLLEWLILRYEMAEVVDEIIAKVNPELSIARSEVLGIIRKRLHSQPDLRDWLMAEHGIDWRTDPAKYERTRVAFLTDIKKEILCT